MNKPKNIHKAAQLIEGLGASSWFTIALEKNLYRIERFSLEGVLECSGLFNVTTDTFDINSLYSFTYISHCRECTILQNKKSFKFYKINEY